MKKVQTTKKGFSLIESMIAVFIFSLVAIMLTGSFAGFLKSYKSAKKIQKSAESAQYVINLMAKSIRNSEFEPTFNLSLIGNQVVTMFDRSRSLCVIYKYEMGVLKMATAGGGSITDVTKCNVTNAPALATFSPLTKVGDIFDVAFVGSTAVGKILMTVDYTNNPNSSRVQTTVSLRD